MPGESPKSHALRHPTLTAINQRHKDGQDAVSTEAQLKDLLTQLNKEIGRFRPERPHSQENLNILAKFWEDHFSYREYADQHSKDSVFHDYKRAIEAIGNVSLVSGTDTDIMKAVASLEPIKKRRVISKLKQLVLFAAGRKLKVHKMKKIHTDVTHLTYEDLEKVLKHIPPKFEPELKLMYRALYWSGCRLGEAEFVKPEHFIKDSGNLKIDAQITEDRATRLPKNNKKRTAKVPLRGREIVEAWCAVPPELKRKVRQQRHTSILGYACEKEFPGQPKKHCTPHELRHCYAIQLLSDGGHLDLVAKSMGNTNRVCEEYYSGYALTEAGLDALEALYRNKK